MGTLKWHSIRTKLNRCKLAFMRTAGGLYLVVRESGDRVWAFRFTDLDGKRAQMEFARIGDRDIIPKFVAELVASAPDVIVTSGSLVVGPMVRATRNIPIVFLQVIDPVGSGLIESMAQPGGNVTGFTQGGAGAFTATIVIAPLGHLPTCDVRPR